MRAPMPMPRSARPGYNPLPDFFGSPGFRDFASNALMDLGYGLTRAPDPWQALGAATQRTAEMQPERDAYATAKKAEAERQREINQTTEWLRANYPQYADLPPDQGFQLAMRDMAQQQQPIDPTDTVTGRQQLAEQFGLEGAALQEYVLTG